MFVLGLFMFAGVFVVGLAIGLFMMFGISNVPTAILEEVYRDGDRNTVAIIPVVGIIESSQAAYVRSAVDYALKQTNIRAIVLRVDSPGGGVTSSDQIWYEIERLKKAGLPIIASYGGIAASGGYYISCAADEIVAEPTCITGSIGVIAQIFTFEGLMDKVGIEPVTLVATGSPEKDTANDLFRSWSDKDRQKIITMLDAAYDTFNQRVKDGRKTAISNAACITGSIGVIAQIFAFEGLMDKVGIEPVTLVATGSPEKDTANDLFRSWSDKDRQKIITMLDAAYDTFNQRVKDGRKTAISNAATIDALADGSIFTAQAAVTNGLVDRIGYLDDAITGAETAAGLRTGSSRATGDGGRPYFSSYPSTERSR